MDKFINNYAFATSKSSKYTNLNIKAGIIKKHNNLGSLIVSIYPLHVASRRKDDANHHEYCRSFLLLKKPFNDISEMEKVADEKDNDKLKEMYE